MPVCPLCPGRNFKNAKALHMHRDSKHSSSIPCGKCNKTFKDQQAFNQHDRDKHSAFECHYCDREFPTENGRDSHEAAKHPKFECNYCDREFATENGRDAHEAAMHSSYECRYCDREFDTEEAREQHEDAKHNFECHYCDRIFHFEDARQQHEDAQHTKYECRHCDREFSSEGARQQHENAKHDFGCDGCTKRFAHVEALWQHQRTVPHFKCKYCTTRHTTQSLRTFHEVSCAYNPAKWNTTTSSSQPASSSSGGPQSAEMARTTAQHTVVESEPPTSPSRSSHGEGEMFHSTSTLPSTESGEAPVQPPCACAHGLDPVTCSACQPTNKPERDDADSIVDIARADETGQDHSMDHADVILQCTPCLKLFETEQTLRDHVCAFRPTVPRPHCPVCYTQFDDGQLLQEHMESLQAFSCQLCLIRCCSDEMLQDHLLSHPTCSKCGQGFADHLTLCAHVEAEHPVVVCWDCGGIVVEKNSLELHYADSPAHPSCTFCGVGMRNSAEMNEHVRQTHVMDAEMKDQSDGGNDVNTTLGEGEGSALPGTQTEEAERPPVDEPEPMPQSSSVDIGEPADEPPSTPLQTETSLYSSPRPMSPEVELVAKSAANTSVVSEATPSEPGSDASRLARPPSPASPVSGSLTDLSASSASESVVFVSAEGIPDYIRENRARLVATSAGSPSSGRTPLRLSSESSLSSLAREAGLAPEQAARTGVRYSFHCRVCLRDPCVEPTATICGHLFCKRCITQAVVAKSECPLCESVTLLYCLFKLDLSV